MAGTRNSNLVGLDGAMLHATLDAAQRNYHSQIYDLREAFDALPASDGERDAGLMMCHLLDIQFHHAQRMMDLLATGTFALSTQSPISLQHRSSDGAVIGLRVEGLEVTYDLTDEH